MGSGSLSSGISALTPFVLLAVLALVAPAAAQDENAHRELIRRQQQSDEFSQQLRQSVERARMPPGDAKRRREVAIKWRHSSLRGSFFSKGTFSASLLSGTGIWSLHSIL